MHLFQGLTLLGVLAPPTYIAFIDMLPIAIELFLLGLTTASLFVIAGESFVVKDRIGEFHGKPL